MLFLNHRLEIDLNLFPIETVLSQMVCNQFMSPVVANSKSYLAVAGRRQRQRSIGEASLLKFATLSA